MDEWGLAISVLVLVITALGAVAGVAVVHGSMKEKISTLERKTAKQEGEIEVLQDHMAKGNTAFAIIRTGMKGIEDKLEKIEQLLTSTASRRRNDGGS